MAEADNNENPKPSKQSRLTYFFKIKPSESNPSSNDVKPATTPEKNIQNVGLSNDNQQCSSSDNTINVTEKLENINIDLRKKRLLKAHFQKGWKTEYPWVLFDRTKQAMFCSDCIEMKKKNSFTAGCTAILKDNLIKHVKTIDHKLSVANKIERRNMAKAAKASYRKCEEAIKIALRNVYYMALNNLPNSDLAKINKLLLFQGNTAVRGLRVDSHTTYEHSDSVDDFQCAISQVVEEDLIKQVKTSPHFAIIMDESTDRACEKTLIIYIKYLWKGDSKTKFLCVTKLEGGKAENIFSKTMNILTEKGLNIKKCCGVASDGASVMMGKHAGVVSLLNEHNPFMVSQHCVAHRLALAASQAAKGVSYLNTFQEILNALFKYYHYSAKRLQNLREMQIILKTAKLKFVEIFDTRWLSFHGALKAIIANYDALISALLKDCQTTHSARVGTSPQGLLNSISNYKFIGLAYFLFDAIKIVTRLSKLFQRKNLNLNEIRQFIDDAIGALQDMKTISGEKYKEFLSKVPTELTEDGKFMFGSHQITDNKNQRDLVKKASLLFLDNLIKNIQNRFPNIELFEAFGILNPKNLPPNRFQLAEYGLEGIAKLSSHYGNSKKNKIGLEFKPLINAEETLEEWRLVKQTLFSSYRNTNPKVVWRKLLTNNLFVATYPNISILASLMITIPVSTVDAERGFSKYNLIKVAHRSNLQVYKVNRLMLISIDTPQIDSMEDFEPQLEKAYLKWLAIKDRRIAVT